MIEIVPGCIRDMTFITANLRKADREEVLCQFREGTEPELLAVLAMRHEPRVAKVKGQPVAAYWFSPMTCSTAFVSLIGTNHISRAVPAVTRDIFTDLIPAWRAQGYRRFEARTLDTHKGAHQWLEACGAKREAVLSEMGRNGETFILYALTGAMIDSTEPKRWQQCASTQSKR